MKFSIFVYFFICLLLLSCKEQFTKNSIADDILVDVYANTLILQEKRKMSGKDSVWLSTQLDSLYLAKHVERREVDLSIQNYQQELKEWKEFYNKVIKRLETIDQEEIAKSKQ